MNREIGWKKVGENPGTGAIEHDVLAGTNMRHRLECPILGIQQLDTPVARVASSSSQPLGQEWFAACRM